MRRTTTRQRNPRPAVCRLIAPAVAACVLPATACGGSDPAQEQEGPFAVGTRTVTFVDESRPTQAFGAQPAKDSRTVVTDLWYPAEGERRNAGTSDAPAEGPFPLVVFNHGQHGETQSYAIQFHTWAEAGYVVAAPRHPLTVAGGPGARFVEDREAVLADIPFVIDRIAEEHEGLVDVDHLALAGHSSGAIAAMAVGLNTCCRDDRVDAVVAEATVEFPLDGRYFAGVPETPVLFAHGTADVDFPIEATRRFFERADPPRFFLSVEGGDHSATFRQGQPAQVVADATLAFLDRYLKERDEALERLRALARRSPVAGLEGIIQD